ncbi:hypothetical protein NVP1003O_67 [Vibrio phage 1.003.O._10N.286.48.A2]|nr:hypothetical protein NVP1003O_67 [Vibrio phage 1.003.O._10N.286.48.A2]
MTNYCFKFDPSKYCMTYNQCDEFEAGMIVFELGAVRELNVVCASILNTAKADPIQRESWDSYFILRTAALEQKPKPTKFVKVEEFIFDLEEEFERGKLYFEGAAVAAISGGVFLSNDEYVKINSKESLCEHYVNGNVYRQVEVDWIESVTVLALIGYGVERSPSNELRIEGSYTKAQALILANAIIESLTDKPE